MAETVAGTSLKNPNSLEFFRYINRHNGDFNRRIDETKLALYSVNTDDNKSICLHG